MPSRHELISSGRTVEEVREIIGADRLVFQDLDDLIEAVNNTKYSRVDEFDCSVFDGNYVAGGIDEKYLNDLQAKRNDAAKKTVTVVDTPVDMTGITGV